MSDKKYVLGIDYGSDSGRAVLIDTANGEELATSVCYYPRWMEGKYCKPEINQYRQHPQDYIDVLIKIITDVVEQTKNLDSAKHIVGMSFDTTGSTPCFVNEEGIPLALTAEFQEDPNAMFVLWKDHTAIKEADEINKISKEWKIDYTSHVGGIYSSEWFWAKAAKVLRDSEAVKSAAYSIIEHCDWMPALVCDKQKPAEVVRSRCSAGHKAMWREEWGGLPDEDYLCAIEPALKGYRERLFSETYTSDKAVGNLSPEWAQKLGLSTDVVVGVGAFDCHMGAVGGEITPYALSRVIGTSTCDIMIVPAEDLGDKCVAGICGQVDGSVAPGYIGLEAGQSAFGDVYAWMQRLLMWPVENILKNSDAIDAETYEKISNEVAAKVLPELSEAAKKIPAETSTAFAIDWMNGRRTPDATQAVKGAIAGINLGTDAPRVFRALVEATGYGSKAIVDRFEDEGVEIKEIIALGGVAQKSDFVMQVMADVLNKPIKVAKSEQTCALGAAMFAAIAAGVHPDVPAAQQAMGAGFSDIYEPNPENAAFYAKLYEEKYRILGGVIENQNL